MKIIELFSGTESFSKVARERGHQTFTLEIIKRIDPCMRKFVDFYKKDGGGVYFIPETI